MGSRIHIPTTTRIVFIQPHTRNDNDKRRDEQEDWHSRKNQNAHQYVICTTPTRRKINATHGKVNDGRTCDCMTTAWSSSFVDIGKLIYHTTNHYIFDTYNMILNSDLRPGTWPENCSSWDSLRKQDARLNHKRIAYNSIWRVIVYTAEDRKKRVRYCRRPDGCNGNASDALKTERPRWKCRIITVVLLYYSWRSTL